MAGTHPNMSTKQTANQTALAAIELQICDEIDAHNDAVATGNQELALMIHLNIQSLKRRRESILKDL